MISTAYPFADVSVEAFAYVPVTITRDEKDAVLRALRLLGAARPGGYHTCGQVIAALESTPLRGRHYPEFRVRPILNALEADNAVVTVPDSGGGARGWQAVRGDGDGLAAVSRRIGDRALALLTGKRPDAGAVLRRQLDAMPSDARYPAARSAALLMLVVVASLSRTRPRLVRRLGPCDYTLAGSGPVARYVRLLARLLVAGEDLTPSPSPRSEDRLRKGRGEEETSKRRDASSCSPFPLSQSAC